MANSRNHYLLPSTKIQSWYDLAEPPEKTGDKSRLITTVSVLGAFLKGVGSVLAVASNWEKIPDFLKLLLLAGTTFATYFIGWRLKYDTRSRPKVGSTLLFLGSLFVDATLFLAPQIFKFEKEDYESGNHKNDDYQHDCRKRFCR
ncbi:MAG: DUF2157 domain-containing protein [Theionarchaea archaeon]|nr:DUF2157 domain-containing protein [Theionarchaea archaeon]MBU7020264.1 DUF2157 domain-containing protein [Theionarchaea archaeon]